MKRVIVFFGVLLLFFSAKPVLSSPPGPPVGKALPDFTLKIPEDPELRSYLGLEGKVDFFIPDIKADVVVIEIFSMY